MKALNMYSTFINGLSKVIRIILVILLSVMVFIMFYAAIMRYVFSNSQAWCEELTIYLCIFAVMFALGLAARSDSHLQVDFLTRLYGPKLRCGMTVFWTIVSIVVMVLFAKYSINLIAMAKSRSVTLPITMGQVYTAFPIGAVILVIYYIEVLWRNIIGFMNGGVLPELPGKKEEGGDK